MVLTLANSTFFWWYPIFAKLGFWWLRYKSSITCYGSLSSLTPCLRIVTVPNSFPSQRDGFRLETHFILKEDLWHLFVSLYTTCPEGDDLTRQTKSFGGNTDDNTVPWTRYSAIWGGILWYSQKGEQLGMVLCNIIFSDTAGEFVFPLSLVWAVGIKKYWFLKEKHFRKKIQKTSVILEATVGEGQSSKEVFLWLGLMIVSGK